MFDGRAAGCGLQATAYRGGHSNINSELESESLDTLGRNPGVDDRHDDNYLAVSQRSVHSVLSGLLTVDSVSH